MDQDKRLYIMAGFDPDTERRLSERERLLENKGFHGQQTRGIPHHLTLGDCPTKQEEQVRALVARVAAETAAFPVTFNHLGLFSGGRVLFAAPDASHELLSLRERFGPAFNWTPHATLLIAEPELIVRAVTPAIQAFEPFDGRVESLLLYEFFPARPILNLPLTGIPAPDSRLFDTCN